VTLPIAFPAYIAGFLVFPQAYKARMSEVIIWRPFHKFKLSDQQGFEPQCQMSDYAASGIARVVMSASASFCFGIIRLGMVNTIVPRLLTSVNAGRPGTTYSDAGVPLYRSRPTFRNPTLQES